MNIEDEVKLDYDSVLIRPKRSTLNSRSEVDLNRTFKFKNGQSITTVGLIASNMDGVGNFGMAKALAKHKIMTVITKSHTFANWDENKEWVNHNLDYVAMSVGSSEQDFSDLKRNISYVSNIKFICVDIANGYSEHFVKACKRIRDEFPNQIIMAGNVVTREMTEELILNGVDIVKVGIGPGSVCTTRKIAGVGFPQLSAVIECADAAHGLGGKIIADGGCTCPGDVAKAFGAGADFVMLGGMFAGCAEGGGEIIQEMKSVSHELGIDSVPTGEKFIRFYGMSSKEAHEKHGDSLKDYRSSEGKCVEIPYKGSIDNVVQDILGGVRSACTYSGARTLKDLSKCTTFIRVNNQINNVFKGK